LRYRYLFGPVPSRRLGVSLGIDLFEGKSCSLNCVYCECGPTPEITLERKEYVPTRKVIGELDHYLASKPDLDYITFSGAGEPLLHSGIGEIISHLKDHYKAYRVALLTNGTLCVQPEVREGILRLDLVIPSLDAVSEEIFNKINRPHPSLSAKAHLEGLIALRKAFPGVYWLEVFIVPGLNDTPDELTGLREAIEKIGPDQVHLNTLDRPAAEFWVEPVTPARLLEISDHLKEAKIVTDFGSRRRSAGFHEEIEAAVLSLLRRRPCTAEDLTRALDVHAAELNKYLNTLMEEGRVTFSDQARGRFYKIKKITRCQNDA